LAKATEIKRGMVLVMDKDLWNVIESTHVTPGNWRGMVQVTMKNIRTGSKRQHRFGSTEIVETAFLDKKKMQYSFKDSSGYSFMDVETYEQMILTDDEVGDAKFYLKENEEVVVTLHEGVAIGLELPSSVVLTITETTPGTKGDTVSNVFKDAMTDTGLKVKVPLFLTEGEKIKVDTRTGEFQGRENG